MQRYMHIEEIDRQIMLEPPTIRLGRNRHQFDFSGTSGTVKLEIDFGTGFRVISDIDLTKTDRVPFVIEAAVRAFRITPDVVSTMAYYANEVS